MVRINLPETMNLTNPSDHTVCQTGFFIAILHLDVYDHTTVPQTGFL